MKSKIVKKISRLAMFLAIGIILNIIESFIPPIIPIPGIRLGMANTIGLIVLYFYSPAEFVEVGFLRVLIVGLIRGNVMSFTISFMGWLFSTIIVILLYYIKRLSIYGLSVCSAIANSCGQIVMVIIYYKMALMVNYLPILLFVSTITGLAIAYLSSLVCKHLDVLFKN